MDIERFRDKKRVLVALSPNRKHAEMEKFTRFYEPMKAELEANNTVIFIEDDPSGPVHDRLECADDEFRFALIGFHGQVEMESHFTMLPDQIRAKLHEPPPIIH